MNDELNNILNEIKLLRKNVDNIRKLLLKKDHSSEQTKAIGKAQLKAQLEAQLEDLINWKMR